MGGPMGTVLLGPLRACEANKTVAFRQEFLKSRLKRAMETAFKRRLVNEEAAVRGFGFADDLDRGFRGRFRERLRDSFFGRIPGRRV